MAQKKQSEIINRLIAEVKLAVLQLNRNTTGLKLKQASLSQDQLNILGGNVYTTAEKNKVAAAITDLSAYTTTSALTQLLAGKQASLSQDQQAVVDAKPFTDAEKSFLGSLKTGGRYLGDIAVDAGEDVMQYITLRYGGTNTAVKDPSLNLGDHVEVIQPGAEVGTLTFTTYTYTDRASGGTTTYEWLEGASKKEHLKGGSIDAYSTTQADARFAPLADVSMDDATIIALEAITITN